MDKPTKAVEAAEKDNTRERIAAAAARLFAAHGFHGVSTKQICDEAGANVAAINYHYGGKENLFRDLVKRFGDLGLQRLSHLLKSPATADGMAVRLELFLEESVDMIRSQPDLSMMIFRDAHLMGDLLDDVFKTSFLPLHKAVVSFIDGAKKNGVVSKDVNADIAASLLFDLVSSIARECPLRNMFTGFDFSKPKDRDLWLKQTVRIYMKGVCPQ